MTLWDLHHTFPTELLSEIFLHLIASAPSSSPTSITTIQHPLLVSHVCTHWRTAALATPRLWARLFIQLVLSKAESQAALVHTWMKRSGGCPLTVYVFWEEPPFASSHPALECLLQHSVRWKEMFFYLPFNVFRRFGKVAGKLPLLTDLSLGTDTDVQDMFVSAEDDEAEENDGEAEDNDNDGDIGSDGVSNSNNTGHEAQLEMFKYAPKLASLECVNVSPFLFTVPWSNLTNIPVVAVTIEECLSILHQATSLQRAGFIFLTTSSSPIHSLPSIVAPVVIPTTVNTSTSTGTPVISSTAVPISDRGLRSIHHPSLTHLSILTSPWDESIDLTPLFPLLSLPNLVSLTICNLKSHFCTSGFTSFLSRLYSLQTLHLRKTALSDQNLVAGLRMVPSVEKLVVHPLLEGLGPPNMNETVFDELRWKSWVVDGEYTEFDENVLEDQDEEGDSGDEGDSSDSESGTQAKPRKRSNSGLPLLPKLTSIEVKLDNTTADAFIHMIHSRRTSVHFPCKPYKYRKAKSPHNEGENDSTGLVVAGRDDKDGEDDSENSEDEIDKPSILEHVRIRFSEPLHPHFVSEFEDLQRDGLKVELDYMNENGGIEFNLN